MSSSGLTRLKYSLLRSTVNCQNPSWFLNRAVDAVDRRVRKSLVRQFRKIHRYGQVGTQEKELLVMADFLLSRRPPGPMIECGCYVGGTSAKLSLLAEVLEKKLYLCDSFEGLPSPGNTNDGAFSSLWLWGERANFQQGQYYGDIETVRKRVRDQGRIECCQFVKGWFSDTLPNLDVEPGFIFMDVDLISSARDVLRILWPKLRVGGRLFTHEAGYKEYILGITEGDFWIREIGQPPPALFGAGYGCGIGAGSLAYFEKQPPTSSF